MIKTDIERIKEIINLFWDDSIGNALAIHTEILDKECFLSDVAGLLYINNGHVSHSTYSRYKNEDIKNKYSVILDNVSDLPSNIWNVFAFEGKDDVITITNTFNETNSKSFPSIETLFKWLNDNNLQHRFLTDKDTVLDNLDKKNSTRILLEYDIPDVRNPNYNRGRDIFIKYDIHGYYFITDPIYFRK